MHESLLFELTATIPPMVRTLALVWLFCAMTKSGTGGLAKKLAPIADGVIEQILKRASKACACSPNKNFKHAKPAQMLASPCGDRMSGLILSKVLTYVAR